MFGTCVGSCGGGVNRILACCKAYSISFFERFFKSFYWGAGEFDFEFLWG